jgi:hypothetical protein
MRRNFAVSAIVAALAFVHLPVASAETPVFLLDSAGLASTELYHVDQANGHLSLIGSLPIEFGEALGLAAASDNLLYVATSEGKILELTVDPLAIAQIGAVGGYLVGLAYSGRQLLAIDEGTNELSRIDILSLTKIVVGTVRLGSTGGPILDIEGGDLAEDAAGNWVL